MSNKEPRISVVVPTYNCAKYLGQAIDSILAQSKPAFEVIVVDDGSTDDTASLLATFQNNVSMIRQENKGVSSARNAGISAATGDWIAFLDSDDIWLPNKLELYIEAMASFPDSTVYYSEFCFLEADSLGVFPAPESLYELTKDIACDADHSGWIYHQLLLTNWVLTSTAVVKRSIFDEIGMFDENLVIAEDWDLFLRISRHGTFYKIKHPLTLYRITPNSLTKTIKPIDYIRTVLNTAINQHGLTSPDGQHADLKEFRRRAYIRQFEYGLAAFNNKWYTTSKKSMSSAIRCKPLSLRAWLYLCSATIMTTFKSEKDQD